MIYGNDIIQFLAAAELTIASGAITVTQGNHKLQPESGTADDLATINGTTEGQFGVLYVSDFGTDTITIKHNTGNILCVRGTDITLSHGCLFWYSNGTKVFVSGDGGGLTNANVSPTTADITLSVNTRNFIDASGLTADRALKFPAGVAGDLISLHMIGQHATYAPKLQGDTGVNLEGVAGGTEWDRLWNTGMSLDFVYRATDGWRKIVDTRRYWRKVVLTGTAADIDIANIPPRYHDMDIEFFAKSNDAAATVRMNMQFNGDTGSNYTDLLAVISHSATLATTEEVNATVATQAFIGSLPAAGAGATNQFASGNIRIPNYVGAVGSKSIQSRTENIFTLTTGNVRLYDFAALWNPATPVAINRVRLFPSAGSLIAGCSAIMTLR